MSLLRPITLSEHPDHVAVFDAANMDEAILRASDEFLRDGIQGAIWHAVEPAIDWTRELSLKAAFKQTGFPVRYDDIEICTQPSEAAEAKILLAHDLNFTMKKEDLEDARWKTLQALSRKFKSVTLQIRHERQTNTWSHIDSHYQPDPKPANPEKLFSGVPSMRVLCARSVGGTRIDDWQVAVGDYIFIMNDEGVEGKALEHAAPAVFIAENDLPRVVDLYDFRCD